LSLSAETAVADMAEIILERNSPLSVAGERGRFAFA
jgi:hypothetical protein